MTTRGTNGVWYTVRVVPLAIAGLPAVTVSATVSTLTIIVSVGKAGSTMSCPAANPAMVVEVKPETVADPKVLVSPVWLLGGPKNFEYMLRKSVTPKAGVTWKDYAGSSCE